MKKLKFSVIRSRRLRYVIFLCVLTAVLAAASRASWYIDATAAASHLGGPSQLGPYATRTQAEAVIAASPNYGLKLKPGGFDDANGGAAIGNYSSDPRLQAAGMLGNAIGQELGKALFGDPEAIRNNQLAQQAQARARQEAAAIQARKRQEQHDRLASQLKLSKGSDGNGAGLGLHGLKVGDGDGGGRGLSLKDIKMGDSDGGNLADLKPKKRHKAPSTPTDNDGSSGDASAQVASSGNSIKGVKAQKKTGDNAEANQVGNPSLPGLALNAGQQGYGIPGLPGIYLGGPRSGSGMTPSGEAGSKTTTETGDSAAANPVGNPNLAGAGLNGGQQASGIPEPPDISTAGPRSGPGMTPSGGEAGSRTNTGESSAALPAPASGAVNPRMTAVNDMAPDQTAVPSRPAPNFRISPPQSPAGSGQVGIAPGQVVTPQMTTQSVGSLQRQANVSQAIVTESGLENASSKARNGFDTAPGPAAAPLVISTTSDRLPQPSAYLLVPPRDATPSSPASNGPVPPLPVNAGVSTNSQAIEKPSRNYDPAKVQAEIQGLQEALRRLNRSKKVDADERKEWEERSNAALRDSFALGANALLDGLAAYTLRKIKTQDAELNRAGDLLYGETDPNRREQLHAAFRALNDRKEELKQIRERLESAHDTVDTLDTIQDMAFSKQEKESKSEIEMVWGYCDKCNILPAGASQGKAIVDAAYDITTQAYSAQRLKALNANSEQYLKAVAMLSKKLEMLVKLKKAQTQELSN